MSERRTHASVTDVDCSCGYLQRAADDPDVPIRFEASTGEYQFIYPAEVGGQATLIIFHCPFCGGAAPRSKRELLFHVIPDAEEERLKELLLPIETIADALERFGEPEFDSPFGTAWMRDEASGEPGAIEYARVLRYESLSEVATVDILESPGGRVGFSLSGKRKNQPPS